MNYFFDGRKRYADDRLWKLRRFGWIQKIRAVFAGHDLYLTSKSAHDFFSEQSEEVPVSFEVPDFRTIPHDLLVTDIRFLFERIGFGGPWISERVWKMGRPASEWAPDGVIHIGGDPVAIEVECVQKSHERYRKIFWRYKEERSIGPCLYIAEESFLKTLMEEAKDFPGIYFTSIAELFEKKEKTTFKNAAGESFTIEDNLEKKRIKPTFPFKISLSHPL